MTERATMKKHSLALQEYNQKKKTLLFPELPLHHAQWDRGQKEHLDVIAVLWACFSVRPDGINLLVSRCV